MASYALGSIGSYFGGPIGGFIGATIGSMIDNKLFPSKVEGPRLGDLRVTGASYGAIMPVIYGRVRTSGLLLWSSSLIETATETDSGKGGPSVTQTEYSYRASVAIGLCEGVIDHVEKIILNGKVVYDSVTGVTDWGLYSDVQVYPGNLSQLPDPTIESYEGVGNVPGYIGTAYIVISDLQLADFGNRLPNFEFVLVKNAAESLPAVILDICGRCGLDPNTISTSSLQDRQVRGFAIGSASSGVGALQPLALAYNFDIAEESGSLRFLDREKAVSGSIIEDYLAGHDAANDRPELIRWERQRVTNLPQEASCIYLEDGRDLQQGTQRTERQAGSANNNLSASLALVLTPDEAREIADRMLWEAWTAMQTATAATDDRCHWIEAGKSYVFPTPAGFESLRVTDTVRGANGVIELMLARDRNQIYIASSQGAPSSVPANEPALPGDTELILLDAPLLLEANDDPGFYWATGALEPGWRGMQLLRSTDLGVTYDPVNTNGRRAVIGTLETALGSVAQSNAWDYGNTLTVRLLFPDHSLASLTELGVLNGGNAAWIGDWDGADGEIIQFADAVQVSDDLWELSTFLRARKGTDYAIGNSLVGHAFVLLQPTNIRRSDFGAGDWNKSRLYKPVSLLTTEAGTTPQSFVNTGESKRPLSLVNPIGIRDGSGDVTMQFDRRSRYPQPGVGNGPLPLAEESEAYELEILDGAVVVRTETLSTPEYYYSAANQTSDGLTPGDPVSGSIYQISGSAGRGHVLSFTV